VGRLERRVRKLEEVTQRGGDAAAISRLDDEDVFVLADAIRKAQRADEAGRPRPRLTREEAEAQARFEELRADAIREGWGDSAFRSY
jgi:hypothetical protein